LSSPVLSDQTTPSPRKFVARWFTFPAAIGFLLLLTALFSNLENRIVEPDIWWHLQNAKYIMATHSLPRVDQYSFTAAGSPWIDHEWLSELAYYGAYRTYGLRGIAVMYFAISAIIFAALYYLCCRNGANPKTAAIVAIFGILLGSVSFGPRMLLFGWLCMIALLAILQRFASSRTVSLWLLPLLFGLWINLHGSWLFGLVVLGIFIACGLVRGEWGVIYAERFTAAEFKRLITTAVLALAALFVNPFGYKLVAYPFDLMLRQQININNIDEWRSVDFHDPRGKLVMVLLLAILASTLLSRRRWKLHEVLLGAFAMYASLMYWRMQFFAALAFVPLLAAHLTLFPPYDERKEKPLLNAAIMVAVIVILFFRFPTEAKLQERVRGEFPEAALAFMSSHGIGDRVFNDYLWGGYIIWQAPQIKTFIDGRADIFVYKGVFDDYLKASRIEDTFAILDRYDIKYALLGSGKAMSYLLAHNSCWRQIYSDKLAILYQRNEACKLPGASPGSGN
jgi:hypothetical protein